MKEDINNKIIQKIRERLLSHEEEYQDGAWEAFLAKKKEKKRRVFFWYFRGIAASVVMLLAIGILWWNQTPQNLNSRTIITEENPKEPDGSQSKEDMLKQKPIEDTQRSVIADTDGQNNQNNTEGKKDTKPIDKTFPITNSNIETLNATSDKKNAKQKPFKNKMAEMDVGTIATNNHTTTVALKKDTVSNNVSVVTLIKAAIKEFKLSPNSGVEIILPHVDNQNVLASNLNIFIEDIKEKSNKKIELGLQLSPSLGSGTDYNESIASSSFGAGLVMNIPINNSNISFSTGAGFDFLNITNDRTTKKGEFSSTSETFSHNETTLYSIDVPLNFAYNLPNNNIYIQAGVSSYLTFKENIDVSSTFVREVEVFHVNNGIVETFTTTESVTTKENSENEEVKFQPFGSINVSFGYRATLSNKLIYEIQPFYKYPLNALTSQGDKTHTAGIALKLFFFN